MGTLLISQYLNELYYLQREKSHKEHPSLDPHIIKMDQVNYRFTL